MQYWNSRRRRPGLLRPDSVMRCLRRRRARRAVRPATHTPAQKQVRGRLVRERPWDAPRNASAARRARRRPSLPPGTPPPLPPPPVRGRGVASAANPRGRSAAPQRRLCGPRRPDGRRAAHTAEERPGARAAGARRGRARSQTHALQRTSEKTPRPAQQRRARAAAALRARGGTPRARGATARSLKPLRRDAPRPPSSPPSPGIHDHRNEAAQAAHLSLRQQQQLATAAPDGAR